jgi:hypothetical protein
MGTQQILLIVLSVIIVGVAIVVGITMFRNQAIKSNAQALAAEATNLRTEMVQWYKTPIDQGGGGQAALADLNEAGLFTSLGANTEVKSPEIISEIRHHCSDYCDCYNHCFLN